MTLGPSSDHLPSRASRAAAYLEAAILCLRNEAGVTLVQHSHAADSVQEHLQQQLEEARRAEAELRRASAEGPELPLTALSRRLGLGPLDERILLAAVALELDPLFALAASSVNREEPRQGLSPKLMAELFRLDGAQVRQLRLDDTHPLVRAGLLESPAVATAGMLRPWRVPGRVIGFLAGNDALDPCLVPLGGVVEVPAGIDCQHMEAALGHLERMLGAGEEVIICIEGPEGVGRRTLVAVAARSLGRPVVALDAGRLAVDRVRRLAELRALGRECWLRDAVPVVARLDAIGRRSERPRDELAELALAIESPGTFGGPVVITVAPGSELPELARRVVWLRVEAPSPAARERMWRHALAPVLPSEGELTKTLSALVQPYALSPRSIQRAAQNARVLGQGRRLEVADVRAGIAAEIEEHFSGLALRVLSSERWEDLVLPPDTLDEIKAFMARVEHAATVYDRWGFRDKLGRGLGLAALFSGPPGTGKTMVAGLMARTLGLDLYQVDLSQVVSKWVGETEKQLGRIFDAAASGQALLLFDEADALFARRTEVKSANDRYANLEVNYLLQRIERFGGITILTTNLETSVDPAFKRRLAADVRFYPPDVGERERLWRTLLPQAAPRDPAIDFGGLAAGYKDMCGGHIRNAVLRAALLAAAEGTRITQDHLHRAARTEYRAMGRVL